MLKRTTVVFLAFIVLAAIPAQARDYVEKFDPQHPSVFSKVFINGPDGEWNGMLGQNYYVLTNTNPAGGAVRYYHVSGINGETPHSLANSTVSAQVKGRCDGPLGGAGIVYRVNPQNGTYWAFVINDKGGYAIYKRSTSGMSQIMGGTHSAIKPKGLNQLTVRPAADNQVEFLVNGQTMATVGSNDINGHAPGVVVISPGSFGFEKFEIKTLAYPHKP